MKKLFLFFVLIASQYACIKVEPPNALPEYSVYSLLNPTDSLIQVFIARTYSLNESFPIDSGRYISGALVKISDGANEMTLELNSYNKVYEAANHGFLKSGKTFYLTVVIGTDTLSSETSIPEAPELKLEQRGVSENSGQVTVSWNKPQPVSNEFFRLTGNVEFNSSFFPFFYWDSTPFLWQTESRLISNDVIYSPVGNFDFAQYDSARIHIVLESLDENWFDFKNKLDAVQLRTSFSKKFEAPVYFNSNVKNAIGLFGSFSQTEINFILSKP
jgi:hypothetical protein